MHWNQLPENERIQLKQQRRASLLDGLFGIALHLTIIGIVAFMIWYVWRGLRA